VIHEITYDAFYAKRIPVPFAALLKGQGGRYTRHAPLTGIPDNNYKSK